jgi:hypothetical protein
MIKNLTAVALSLASLCVAADSSAAMINIILSDVDVVYQGSNTALYDASAIAGNNLIPVEADPLEGAVFEFGGTPVASLSSPSTGLFGDLLVSAMPASLTKGVYSVAIGNAGGGFGFDFFTSTGQKLELGIGTIDALVTNGVFFFTASATVLSQSLPAGLEFTNPNVVISFTATAPAVQAGPTTNAILASGAMTISGEGVIPEPATAVLGAIAMAGAMGLRRRG